MTCFGSGGRLVEVWVGEQRFGGSREQIYVYLGRIIVVQGELFWSKANCPQDFKLTVFDAVICSKLVYGLEVLHLPAYLMSKLDVFQLKGLRKILNMKTTFVDRNNFNAKVFQVANAIKNPKNILWNNIKPFSQYIREKQQACIKHTIRAPLTDPLRQCTFEPDTSAPINIRNKRVGRPRGNRA